MALTADAQPIDRNSRAYTDCTGRNPFESINRHREQHAVSLPERIGPSERFSPPIRFSAERGPTTNRVLISAEPI